MMIKPMNEAIIRQVIEEVDPEGKIPPGVVDELVGSLQKIDEQRVEEKQLSRMTDNLIEQIAHEPDWRKKAALAARVISQKLE